MGWWLLTIGRWECRGSTGSDEERRERGRKSRNLTHPASGKSIFSALGGGRLILQNLFQNSEIRLIETMFLQGELAGATEVVALKLFAQAQAHLAPVRAERDDFDEGDELARVAEDHTAVDTTRRLDLQVPGVRAQQLVIEALEGDLRRRINIARLAGESLHLRRCGAETLAQPLGKRSGFATGDGKDENDGQKIFHGGTGRGSLATDRSAAHKCRFVACRSGVEPQILLGHTGANPSPALFAMTPDFDPNAAASADSGIFGLPHSLDEAALVYLPVPWEATTSYGGGTAGGPAAVLAASRQVDLFDGEVLRPYEVGLHLLPESKEVARRGRAARKLASPIIVCGGDIGGDRKLQRAQAEVNAASAWLNAWVEREMGTLMDSGKIACLLGGDHSTPFGAIRAAALRHPGLGVLQIDAHADFRHAYEGFTDSHASIMCNVLARIPEVSRLVQVGIRDYCEEEFEFARSQGKRAVVFYDAGLQERRHAGKSWNKTVAEIVAKLPREVWISFDIDGLDPRFCPHTGTPVPGGLDFAEANALIAAVARSGRKIVGFDLNEVSPDPTGHSEWDANVGARMLYKMTAWTLVSQGLRRPRG